MLFQPKKTKYRKSFKPRKTPKVLSRPQRLNEQNCLALCTAEPGVLNGRHIEAARQNIRRRVKREGKLEILILPDLPLTRKASAARMGKGKGKVDHWVAQTPAGKAVFLLYGVAPERGIPALKAGANKLPIKFNIYTL